MCRGAFARQHVIEASLTATALYLWMKCWHTVCASKLHAHLMCEPEAPWTFRRVLRVALIQTAIQPAGLFLRFAAAQIVVPYIWTYGFFQNVCILGDGTRQSLREIMRESGRQDCGSAAHRALGSHSVFVLRVARLFILILTSRAY
jgi:hypothetical protein